MYPPQSRNTPRDPSRLTKPPIKASKEVRNNVVENLNSCNKLFEKAIIPLTPPWPSHRPSLLGTLKTSPLPCREESGLGWAFQYGSDAGQTFALFVSLALILFAQFALLFL